MLRYTTNPALEQIQGLALSSHGYDHLLIPSFVKNSSEHRVATTMEKSLAFSSTNYIPPYDHRDDCKRIRSKRTLVLDSSRGEIVNAPLKSVMKSEANAEEDDAEEEQEQEQEERALVASKIHSEAERRRRERINLHLATLRTILPASFKVNKASLLGEVVEQVKKLKRKVLELYEYAGCKAIPTESNELQVEREDCRITVPLAATGSNVAFRISMCCEDRTDLMSSIKQAFDLLELRMIKAEISTLGGRIKNVFVVMPRSVASNPQQKEIKEGAELHNTDLMIKQVRDALELVMERPGREGESTQGKHGRQRRQRVL